MIDLYRKTAFSTQACRWYPRRLPPPPPAEDLHAPDCSIANTGPGGAARQRRGSRRRHHDPCAPVGRRVIEGDRVVGRIRGHARDVAGDARHQTDAGRGVIRGRLRARLSDDDTGAVDTEMQLLPAPLPAAAVFGGGPFALAEARQARAVDDEMHRLLDRDVIERDLERLAPPRERCMVRRLKIGLQHGEDRPQETLRLAQRPVEDESERQGGLDGDLRVLSRPAR